MRIHDSTQSRQGLRDATSQMPNGRGVEAPTMGWVMTYPLWIVQGVLALLFLFAGGMKLVMPIEALTEQMPLPGAFVRSIGVAEVLGAMGLILPGLLRI